MARKKRKKTIRLSDLGFAMKVEAQRTEGDVLHVSKALWLEIAEVLMETGRNLEEAEKLVDEILKEGEKHGDD